MLETTHAHTYCLDTLRRWLEMKYTKKKKKSPVKICYVCKRNCCENEFLPSDWKNRLRPIPDLTKPPTPDLTLTVKKNGALLGTPVTEGLTGDLCWGVCCYAPGYSFRINAVDPEDF